MFLQQISILELFRKDQCDTEDYDAENSAYITEIGIVFCNISLFLFLIK